MKGVFSIFVLMLLVSPIVIAVEGPGTAPSETQEATSRFLSAEAQRLIKDEFETVKVDLKAYQDENFIALDGEMKAAMSRMQQQVVMGSLGAILLGGAIIALIMFNIAKKFSYEKFLEGQLGNQQFEQGFAKQDAELGALYQDDGVQQMQQEDWGYPNANPTIGQEQGQSFASNNSEFSNWQNQPPHSDGWQWDGGKRQ